MPHIRENPQQYLENRRLIDSDTGCHNWQLSTDRDGYGICAEIIPSIHRAHRLSYAVFVGPIPDHKYVLHSCDNPGCVNPEHLFIGNAQINAKDRVAKGRYVGENSSTAKFSDATVVEVITMYNQGATYPEIMNKTGVSRRHVSSILSGRVRSSVGVEVIHRPRVKYDQAVIDHIREMRSQGHSTLSISLTTGVSRAQVSNILGGRQRKSQMGLG